MTVAGLAGVVFDLDGTLVDTLEDIATSMNAALEESGLPRHPLERYRAWVGEGAERLALTAVSAEAKARAPEVLERFRQHYRAHHLDASRPYPGVGELLAALERYGIPMAVLSNKPHAFTVDMVQALFPQTTFRAVLGERPGVPRKPDPAAAEAVVTALGVPVSRCALLGDTRIDMETARAVGWRPIGVRWGFRPGELEPAGAERVLERPADLLPLLGRG